MNQYRQLDGQEIDQLVMQGCTADDWANIEVALSFKLDYVFHTRFSGQVQLGVFEH